MHGGDLYGKQITIDFSVNINPLGMSQDIKQTLHEMVDFCQTYPDIQHRQLKEQLSKYLHTESDKLLLGNGASELFMVIMHGIKPKKVVIPVPSFYGYEYAVKAVETEIHYYELKKENDFAIDERILTVLTEDVDCLFLANPNNPTGQCIPTDVLKEILLFCEKHDITVILDECFLDFCKVRNSMITELSDYPHLILVNAFTKSFAVPGVRLGFAICGDVVLKEKIQKQLPEWNLSVFAQGLGKCLTGQEEYLKQARDLIEQERIYLTESIKTLGIKVYPSQANYVLLYSEVELYKPLLKYGILIRDAGNYKGLKKGFYRIAVKTRKENEILIRAIQEIMKDKETHQNI